LRLVIFFGCVGIFVNLFRGDVLEKTLHYYFLAPIRREVLAVGKFISGVMTAFVLFGFTTAASFILLYAPAGSDQLQQFVFAGPGFWHLLAYLGVTFLACVGYGAVFLLAGLLFRNPILPVAVILGWESINFLLPPTLKKISVIYYLESLCPVPLPPGPITLLADPAPFWLAVPGLFAVTAVVLTISALRLRKMEISYSTD
jgi:ABC-type transport system involved in multi-copper enzyme maturation permease subunit